MWPTAPIVADVAVVNERLSRWDIEIPICADSACSSTNRPCIANNVAVANGNQPHLTVPKERVKRVAPLDADDPAVYGRIGLIRLRKFDIKLWLDVREFLRSGINEDRLSPDAYYIEPAANLQPQPPRSDHCTA